MHRHRCFRHVLCAALLGALALPAVAATLQESPAAEALPTAREIVDAYARKVNGDRLARTKSFQVTGKAEIPGIGLSGTYRRWQARPGRVHFELDLSGIGQVVTGSDGERAWVVHPLMGAYLQEGAELLQALDGGEYDAAGKDPARYESIETVGRTTFEERPCWEVVTVLKPLPGMDPEESLAFRTTHEFYAVDTGMLIGQKTTAASPTGATPATLVFADYADFDGVLFPREAEQRAGGVTVVFTVDTVTWDQVPADRFELPKPIRTLLEAQESEAGGAADGGAAGGR